MKNLLRNIQSSDDAEVRLLGAAILGFILDSNDGVEYFIDCKGAELLCDIVGKHDTRRPDTPEAQLLLKTLQLVLQVAVSEYTVTELVRAGMLTGVSPMTMESDYILLKRDNPKKAEFSRLLLT